MKFVFFNSFFNYLHMKDLMPRIESLRNDLARLHGSRWRSLLNLTMSFADGSSARINAINAALRIYRLT